MTPFIILGLFIIGAYLLGKWSDNDLKKYETKVYPKPGKVRYIKENEQKLDEHEQKIS